MRRIFRKGLSFGIVLALVAVVFIGIPVNTKAYKSTNKEFTDSEQRLGSANTLKVMFVDIDNDGDPDLIEGNYFCGPWPIWTRVYRNTAGEFLDTGQNLWQRYGYAKGLASGDMDNDGDIDVFTDTAGWAGYPGTLYINDGKGNFGWGGNAEIGGSTVAVGTADLDNDGDLDLVEGNMYNSLNNAPKTDYILYNDGNGHFSDSECTLGMWKTYDGHRTLGIDFIDINNDGFLDIVASCWPSPDRIYINNGFGGFSENNCILLNGIDRIGEVKIGDLNSDGLMDIVSSDGIFLNNGDMSFAFVSEARRYDIDLMDFDLDDDLDLLNDGYLYVNNGLGEFELVFTFPFDPYTTDVADVDGDGDFDCVFGFLAGRPTEIWLNTGINPLGQKLDTLSKLEMVEIDDRKTEGEIDKIIGLIQKSLDNELWLDGNHLDPQHGHKVFNEEKKAVKKLIKLIDNDNTPQNIKDVCQLSINKLITSDKCLAETASEEALNMEIQNPDNQEKYDKEIEKSEEELLKAEEKVVIGDFDKAIDHYKKAWEHAQHAIKHGTK